jgi:hypothetical protein
MVLQADLEAGVAARKALTAAELSVIGDALGTLGIVAGKWSWQGIRQAAEFTRQKLFGRANTALKDALFITDEQSAEIVTSLARVAKVEGKSAVDKAVAAVSITKPGAEHLVTDAAKTNPQVGRAVMKAIDNRAKDLLASTKELTGEDLGRWIREDLEGYKTLVKDEFTRVKTQAAS